MLKRSLILVVIASMLASGCATTVGAAAARSPGADAAQRGRMSEYVQQLPIGSRVRVDRLHGGTLHGTLMAVEPGRIVVQRATRIPEPAVELPLDEVARVQIEERTGIGRGIIIGAAIGAAATFGFLILIATAMNE